MEGCDEFREYLLDDKGEWVARNDVYFQEARIAPEGMTLPHFIGQSQLEFSHYFP